MSFYTKLADMDADGLPDLVAFERFQLSASSYLYDVYIHKNTGIGFAAEVKWAAGIDEPALRDMNGDGRADLVEQTATVFINQGAGFLNGVTWTGAVTPLSHVDANGDGLPDQFNISDQYYFNSGPARRDTYPPVTAQPPTADFNGDRLADYYYTTFMNPYGRAFSAPRQRYRRLHQHTDPRLGRPTAPVPPDGRPQ
ncbi:MAG: hypothetical protein IPM40_03935 [Gammaproteobacteria bacterium]|nr:hypothetical protein [Gammaproteobacteria bacterium]